MSNKEVEVRGGYQIISRKVKMFWREVSGIRKEKEQISVHKEQE